MSSITIKTESEIQCMRQSGKLLTQVFHMLDQYIQPGMTTMQINNQADDYIVNTLGARPASKGQYNYQYAINTSVNDVVCHGVPSNRTRLRSTDIINIDITLEKSGFITDSSKMYSFNDTGQSAKALVQVAYDAMWEGIHTVKPGSTVGDIGYAIQTLAESAGYTIVKAYCGHGIGRRMHEPPNILHYGKRGTGIRLEKGMTFTIEPMLNQGAAAVKTKKDGWTVVTQDKKLSAQWEHTILVTEDGFEVLTLRPEES